MKKWLVILGALCLSSAWASEESYTPYVSYSMQQNGIGVPSMGYEYQKGRERFDVSLGYTRLTSHPSYHYTVIMFNGGYSFLKEEEKDVYLKLGLKLTNIYCRKDKEFDSGRFLIFTQIGVGMKVSLHSNVELFYQPIFMGYGKVNSTHSTYLRFIFHL